MKKYATFLLSLLFASAGCFAQVQSELSSLLDISPLAPSPDPHLMDIITFDPNSITVSADGGTISLPLIFTEPDQWGNKVPVPNPFLKNNSLILDPQITAITNNGNIFDFTFASNSSGAAISKSIRLTFGFEVTNGNKLPQIAIGNATLTYTQSANSRPPIISVAGGIIHCDTTRLYQIGEQPPMITSQHPGLTLIGEIPSYTWEKKTGANASWETMIGKADETCMPDVMGEYSVSYRRKVNGSYSNTITLRSAVNPEMHTGGIIYCDTTRLYQIGEQPPMIISQQPASVTGYTWEKKAESDTAWITMPTQIKEACMPDIMGAQNICYRRKAGIYYSNTITLRSTRKSVMSENYVQTKTYTSNHPALYSTAITYYDGLGRPAQQVLVDGAGDGSGDLITPIVYDGLGRDDARCYLPYVSNSAGSCRLDAIHEQQTYYNRIFPGEIPYTEKIYDAATLNRIQESCNTGKVYRDSSKTVRYDYLSNGSLEVPLVRSNSQSGIEFKGFYAPDRLFKNYVVDEDGIVTISYVDILGRTIMIRTNDGTNLVDTYYVYNDLGQLQAVLPPMAMSSILNAGDAKYPRTHDLIADYCYYYLYDSRGNVIERQFPGKEIEYLIYDDGDRPILSQDGNLREQNRWLYHTYDNFSRKLSTCLIEQQASFTRQDIQNRYATQFDKMFKTIAVLSESKYGRSGSFDIPDYLSADKTLGTISGRIDARTTGLKIYDKIAVVTAGDYDNLSYIERAYYYDYKNRVVQIVEKNHMKGISCTTFEYDLTGNILTKIESHQADPLVNSADTLKSFLTYDHYNRLLSETTLLNTSVPAIIKYHYDDRGQLITKSYGNVASVKVKIDTTRLLKVDKSKSLKSEWSISDILTYGSSANFIDYDIYDFVIEDDSDNINPKYFIGSDATNSMIDYYYIPEMEKLNAEIISWAISMYSDFTSDYSPKIEVVSAPFPGATIELTEIDLYRAGDGECITETFEYNIQGWLSRKHVSLGTGQQLFDMILCYHDPRQPSTIPSYTGNISEWTWQHDIAGNKNTYAFCYDRLGRLIDTKQYFDGVHADDFAEKGLSYDRNGNLQHMTRMSAGNVINELSYHYTGNKLASLTDESKNIQPYTYSYDLNGNMTEDGSNSLNLTYNFLNLTEKVERDGLTLAKYAYLSDGTKLWATDANDFGLSYVGSLVYLKSKDEYVLESAAFNGGRFITTSTGSDPIYFVSDHLGSTRVVVNSKGEILETNDFYPFGLRWDNGHISDNRYRYNGKEEQQFVDTPYIDYGARMYDPQYRLNWNGMDPLAEKYYHTGQYVFCLGNPIKYFDPNGMEVDISDLSQEHHKALQMMLSTPEERAFIERYMAKDATLVVNGKIYKFSADGDRSKDKLWIRSSEMSEGHLGMNSIYTRAGMQELNDDKFNLFDKESDLSQGVHQVIDINSELSKEKAANMLGHEAFVHADKDADALKSMDKKCKSGYYSMNPRYYKTEAQRIATGSLDDHRALGRGEVAKYKNYGRSLVRTTGNQTYMQMHNDDVKKHRDYGE